MLLDLRPPYHEINKTIAFLSIENSCGLQSVEHGLEAELNFVSWDLSGVYAGEMDHTLILCSSETLFHAS
jgi:hypothetical protein